MLIIELDLGHIVGKYPGLVQYGLKKCKENIYLQSFMFIRYKKCFKTLNIENIQLLLNGMFKIGLSQNLSIICPPHSAPAKWSTKSGLFW